MIVKVKRIKTDPWLGIKKYPGVNTPEKICVGLDSRTGERKQVLNAEEQAYFETELGLEKGTLSRNSPYWIEYFVPLDIENTFDTDIPEHALILKVLDTKKIVAKSMDELKKNPYAEYVIYKEAEEAKVSNLSRQSKKKAYALLDKMTMAEMIKTLIAYGEKPYNMDAEVIEDLIGRKLEENPDKFITIVSDPNVDVRIFLNELVHYGIISTKSKQYIYGQSNWGEVERAIDFLMEKENSELYISLGKQLQEAKKRSI